jgi:hypothetical protein
MLVIRAEGPNSNTSSQPHPNHDHLRRCSEEKLRGQLDPQLALHVTLVIRLRGPHCRLHVVRLAMCRRKVDFMEWA